MNNNWYKDYLIESQRRQEEIKAAELYRMTKQDPDSSPAPKAYQRLFSAMRAILSRWSKDSQEQQPAPRRDYAKEQR